MRAAAVFYGVKGRWCSLNPPIVTRQGLKAVDGRSIHGDGDTFESRVEFGIGLAAPGRRANERVFMHPSMVRVEVVFTPDEQAFAFAEGRRHAELHVVLSCLVEACGEDEGMDRIHRRRT